MCARMHAGTQMGDELREGKPFISYPILPSDHINYFLIAYSVYEILRTYIMPPKPISE